MTLEKLLTNFEQQPRRIDSAWAAACFRDALKTVQPEAGLISALKREIEILKEDVKATAWKVSASGRAEIIEECAKAALGVSGESNPQNHGEEEYVAGRMEAAKAVRALLDVTQPQKLP